MSKGLMRFLNPLMIEKRWFPWRAARILRERPVLFPGCSAMNHLPETVSKLMDLCDREDVGWMADCCGKPLGQDAGPVLERIRKALQAQAVPELIVLCPNCRVFLTERLGVRIRTVYDWLESIGVTATADAPEGAVFLPCPDRKERRMLEDLERWSRYAMPIVERLPCCGLDPELTRGRKGMIRSLRQDGQVLLPYCASCYGQFSRKRIRHGPHLLSWGLGCVEKPVSVAGSLWGRLKPLLRRR